MVTPKTRPAVSSKGPPLFPGLMAAGLVARRAATGDSMFSTRLPGDFRPNPLTRALHGLRQANTPILDLTESNPTRVGLAYPAELFNGLPDALDDYDPHPLGSPAARAAVAAHLPADAAAVPPGQVVLTASTSEAYSLIFKLLCDGGDEVLVPRPSYPLFEHLTRLDGVTGVPYDLEYHGRWEIDPGRLAAAVSPRTRAILLVSPNNPTGSYVTADELAALRALAALHGLALIGDEVFRAYPLAAAAPPQPSVLAVDAPLVFSLGGLSKTCGLPQ